MKVLLLGDLNSIHMQRWVSALNNKGIEVRVLGLSAPVSSFYKDLNPSVNVYFKGLNIELKKNDRFEICKLKYLKAFKYLRSTINDFSPDIIHAHYATSYGLLGVLSCYHPLIISVWGSDVYDFPRRSFFHRAILRYNFSKADRILSTSHIMAKETQKYTTKNVLVTPFGVDISKFRNYGTYQDEINEFVIGNVKSLSAVYGIDVLLKGVKIVIDKNPGLNVRLILVGDGPDRALLERLAFELSIRERVSFVGKVDNDLVPQFYNSFSVAVFTSLSESFGVSVVEAMACECPVIVSDVDGFLEVVDENSSMIVQKNSPEQTADAIQKFIDDRTLRFRYGKSCRERVLRYYDWKDNLSTMLEVYQGLKLKNNN